METLLIVVFVISYLAIALEHPLHINKTASALVGAGILWTIYAMSSGSDHLHSELGHSLEEVAQIVFFLLGAMTIVELIDAHSGFDIITSRIKTTKLSKLLFLVAVLTFFLSAILDNLTTTIVMVSLIKKVLGRREDRLLFAGLIVITSNAGGAWSPIGDVTTTMLWVGGQITSVAVITNLFIPSVVAASIPVLITVLSLKGFTVDGPANEFSVKRNFEIDNFDRNLIFGLGIGALVAVPVFKVVTHLPPFMGVLFGLGILWVVTDLLHKKKDANIKGHFSLGYALSKIDMSSIIFFIGILLAVATLQHSHILSEIANWLDQKIGNLAVIVMLIGLFSSVVDNVPMVAASISMYSMAEHPVDSFLWQFLAFCAGTGGSMLIIGSAAGLAAMGLEKIDFFWYLKKMSFLALLGYLGGAFTFLLQYSLVH
jgi:Na+/H+ antiporter NhaD/arsenite permease-like protein